MRTLTSLLLISASAFAQTSPYPTSLDSLATLKYLVNGTSILLTQNINSSVTTFTVSSCGAITANVLITIDQEIMSTTGCSGTTWVGSRGFDGSTAASHAQSTVIFANASAWNWNALSSAIIAVETALGASLGNVVQAGSNPSFASVTATTNGMTASKSTGYAYTANGSQGGFSASVSQLIISGTTTGTQMGHFQDTNGTCTITSQIGISCTGTQDTRSSATPTFAGETLTGPLAATAVNYVGTETGANNALAGTFTGAPSGQVAGLCVLVSLASHTLQAGANTFNLNSSSPVSIKSHFNTANNIATAYSLGGSVLLCGNGSVWTDMAQ